MELTLAFKIIGGLILFVVTFLFTLLPHRLRNIQAPKLKTITSFCGGLFLGLCFLHLLPDTMRQFNGNAQLKALQDKYPMAELIIMLGLIIVLSAEKLASIIQINKKTKPKKCDGSENCCKVTCNVQGTAQEATENSPLVNKIEKSCVEEQEVQAMGESDFEESSTNEAGTAYDEKENSTITSDDSIYYQSGQSSDGEGGVGKYQSLSSNCTTKKALMKKKKSSRLMKIRTLCLVIALMVHSLFEGLTVGLQTTKTGVVILIALLTFHKCLIGFSLGIALVNDKSDFKSYQKKAAMFAVSSPIGVILGIILFSANLGILNEETVSILTALSTGTFIYVTFFEILAKSLEGDKVEDMVGFVCFIVGFALFAGLTAIPEMQV